MLAVATVVSGLVLSPAGAHDIHTIPEASNPFNPATPWPPTNNPLWAIPDANPPITGSCGINVGILVDRSGSIADAGAQTTMRNSAKSIVDLFAGTPSKVGVWSFAEDSSATGTAEYPARQLTSVGGTTGPSGVTALHATIDSIPIVSNRATNWEAGFTAVHDATVSSGTAPDLLFVLTDGNPTVHYNDPNSGGVTNNDDVDGGIEGANAVKGDSTRVLGVGIGANIDSTSLGLIANPEAFTGDNVTTAGYTITDFAHLQQDLKALVTSLCGGSISVQKLVDGGNGQFAPASGWSFTVDPTNGALPNQTAVTDANGQLQVKVDSTATEQVTLTETLQAGYRFLAGVTCTNSNGPNPTLTPVTNGVRFDLDPTAIVSCSFKNQKQTVDLSILKSDGGISAHPGDVVTSTLTYGNAGNSAAPNTTITETVPVNTSFDLGTGPADGKNDGWVCNGSQSGVWPAGTTCTRNVGTVAAGASGLTVPFSFTVDKPFPALVNQISNTASIGYDNSAGADTNPSNNTASDTTPVVVTPQLQVVKTVAGPGSSCPSATDSTTIVSGESVDYCYTLTNPGDSAARNVTLVDDNGTPADPSDDVTVSLSGLANLDGGGQANDLAAGGTATGHATRSFVGAAAGTVVNTATATAVGVSASDTASVTVTRPAVTIVKTAIEDEPGQSCPGVDGVTLKVDELEPVRFCYAVTNTGTAPLLDVTVVDDNGTPADPTDDFTVTLTGLANLDGGATANDLAPGATATGSAGPFATHAGTVTNTATVSGTSKTKEVFTDTDDATWESVDVIPTITVTKDDKGASVAAPGGNVEYTVTVGNPGTEPVTITTMTDSIEGGAPFSILTPATAPVLATTCAAGTVVPAQGSVTCAFTVRVSGTGGEQVHDVVHVTAVDDEQTPVTANDDDTTPVTPVADVSVDKTMDQASLEVGQQGTYSLVVTNHGPSTATNLVVVDKVPAGLTVVSVTPSAGWTCTGTGPITCTTPSLAVGASATIRVTVLAGAAAVPAVKNVVDVSATEPDPVPENNHDEVVTPISAEAPASTTPVTTAPAATTVPASVLATTGTLPTTGSDTLRFIALALLLVGAGAVLVRYRNRRTD